MVQGAVQLNESVLQRCQPFQLAVVHSFHQLFDGVFAVPLFAVVGTITAIAPFSQELLFPPALDAFGHEVVWFGLFQAPE